MQQDAGAPVPIETRPEVIESTQTNEKIESVAEKIADSVEPASEVALAPTMEVALEKLEQPAAPVAAQPETLGEKMRIFSSFFSVLIHLLTHIPLASGRRSRKPKQAATRP